MFPYIYMCVCVSILYHQDRYPVLCFLYSEDQKKKTELCKHMRKESECYFTLIFLLKFLNCCLPEQIFNCNWIILEEEKKNFAFFSVMVQRLKLMNLKIVLLRALWKPVGCSCATSCHVAFVFTSWSEYLRCAQPLKHSGLIMKEKQRGRDRVGDVPTCTHCSIIALWFAFNVCLWWCAVCWHA